MTTDPGSRSGLVVERLDAAMNAHDIEAFVACFDEEYESEQPAHPDRAFRGRDLVRQNWSAIFEGVPDFESELLRAGATGETEWSEWRWRGTQADGTLLDMAGVIVCGVRAGRLRWARLYVEPVEQGGAGIDAAVRRMAGEERSTRG
jgi:ketosteroid isomerase-like protein